MQLELTTTFFTVTFATDDWGGVFPTDAATPDGPVTEVSGPDGTGFDGSGESEEHETRNVARNRVADTVRLMEGIVLMGMGIAE